MNDVDQVLVRHHQSIRDILNKINQGAVGAALLVDENGHFLDIFTDGDIRRSILDGITLDATAEDLHRHKISQGHVRPFTASSSEPREDRLRRMRLEGIRHIPVLDESGIVVEFTTIEDVFGDDAVPLNAVIMAGGFGKRLMPLTSDTPKPMLHVGDRPLLEHTIDQLREAGIFNLKITTHYLPEKIKSHFEDGAKFGVSVDYIDEETPLGTAGALSLMPGMEGPTLVLNGDILTNLDYRALLRYHQDHKAALTMCVRSYDFQVPYGVVESHEAIVHTLSEKPILTYFVNAGIYLLEPDVQSMVPSGERYDMTDLVKRLLSEGRRVVSFPLVEHWLDIGQHEDFERAQELVKLKQAE